MTTSCENGPVSVPAQWDLWVDFTRVYDGLTYADVRDAGPGVEVEPGRYLVVGDEDAEAAVAQVVEVKADGVILLRVLPGPVHAHLALIGPRPA